MDPTIPRRPTQPPPLRTPLDVNKFTPSQRTDDYIPIPAEQNIVRRGEAIAHVRAVEDRCAFLEKELATTARNLQTANDRMALLAEERTKWRAAAEAHRADLIALASDVSAIGLLCQRAQDTHSKIGTIIHSKTPPESHHGEDGTDHTTSITSEAIRKLRETAGSANPVAPVHEEPARTEAGDSSLAEGDASSRGAYLGLQRSDRTSSEM